MEDGVFRKSASTCPVPFDTIIVVKWYVLVIASHSQDLPAQGRLFGSCQKDKKSQMLTEEIIERSLALREVTGRRADGPHGLVPAGQTGYGHTSRAHGGSREKLRLPGSGESRFAISFKEDSETGELKLVRRNP